MDIQAPHIWVPKPAIILPSKQILRPKRHRHMMRELIMLGMIPGMTGAQAMSRGRYTGHMWTDADQRAAGGGSVSFVDFTNFYIGPAQDNRHTVLTVAVQSAGSGVTFSVTVNGVGGAQTVGVNDGSTGIQEYQGVHTAAVPTGELVTVRVTFSGAGDKGVSINGYAMYGKNATATATITDNNSDPMTGSLNTATNGVAIGGAAARSNDVSASWSWSGLTEDGLDFFSSASYGSSSASATCDGSAISVSADFNGTVFNSTRCCMAAASYPPA